MAYALGRGVEYYDRPTLRRIVREASRDGYPLVVGRHRHRLERAIPDAEDRIMIVTRKAVPRRTVLRGLGATLALPLLDSMVPALTATAQTPASAPLRFGVVYVPNGMVMQEWTPAAGGRRLRVPARR